MRGVPFHRPLGPELFVVLFRIGRPVTILRECVIAVLEVDLDVLGGDGTLHFFFITFCISMASYPLPNSSAIL